MALLAHVLPLEHAHLRGAYSSTLAVLMYSSPTSSRLSSARRSACVAAAASLPLTVPVLGQGCADPQRVRWRSLHASDPRSPPYLVAAAFGYMVSVASDRTRQRGIYILIGSLISLAGLIMVGYSTNVNVRCACPALRVVLTLQMAAATSRSWAASPPTR